MEPIYWAALVSFIIGAFGYIIVRFWIIPIVRYKKAKSRLKASVVGFYKKIPQETEGKNFKKLLSKKDLQQMRGMGMKLVEIHEVDLPYWYRLVLLTRKEAPETAVEHLLKLENMQSPQQAKRCIADIGEHLRITIA